MEAGRVKLVIKIVLSAFGLILKRFLTIATESFSELLLFFFLSFLRELL